jgi:hypothetical protein
MAQRLVGRGLPFGLRALKARQVMPRCRYRLRFVVDPAERLNIRLDYGYGTEGGYFYFVVGESF